ncbi:CPBP family intramembrane glutamic endopeptidase [Actibacterium ureilyticum]|uniref:CPBP family intramembrane glutamic endopeptidase n=1 Tax=Actibacterium ureilyticum TaxID=1590614 RepID=UPI000BAAC3F2|nr:type II CAAX endopeptidase family protein [Actibacterium ureilyticum]
MPQPEFQAMVQPARLYPQIWRLLLGLLLMMFVFLGFFAMMAVVAYPIVGPLNYFGFIQSLQKPVTIGTTLFVLISFIGMFLAPIIAAPACHLRPAGTLFGPRGETLRGFGLTVLVLAPIYAGLAAAAWWFIGPEPNMALGTWLRLLPLAALLVLIQVTAEELIFRGYLPQQLAARFNARWVWMGIPSLVFAALHYNPEAGATAWLIVLTTFLFALIAMDLTERTGSLGVAIGLHFVNNLSALLFLSVKGTITGLALYVTPFGVAEASALGGSIAIDLLMLFLIWRLLRLIVIR